MKKRLLAFLVTAKTWVGNTGTQAVMHLYADNVDTGKSVTLDTSNN